MYSTLFYDNGFPISYHNSFLTSILLFACRFSITIFSFTHFCKKSHKGSNISLNIQIIYLFAMVS